MNDKVALWILGFVSVLEALNVGRALITGDPTLASVDLLFTSTGGAILTDSLSRRRKAAGGPDPNAPDGGT